MTESTSRIRVLVVDDSDVDRMLLINLVNSDARFQIVGTAASGAEAISLNEQLAPSIILMAITRGDNRVETIARIMGTKPVPIVLCSGTLMDEGEPSFRAMAAGALALVAKPSAPLHPDHAAQARKLKDTLVNMAEVKLVRRWHRTKTPTPSAERNAAPAPRAANCLSVVVIGASTGGPPVLNKILSLLPPDFPLPILVVQHIAPGFLAGMAHWLKQTSCRNVHIARTGDRPLPGEVYLAPDDCHMGVDADGVISLQSRTATHTHCPAVAQLFRSLAQSRLANRSIAVLLTGMGVDGAKELLLLRQHGAITIAQDAKSSVVHGMPGEAIRLGAALHVQPPEGIAALLAELVRTQTPPAVKPESR